jgi:hypothetical protein
MLTITMIEDPYYYLYADWKTVVRLLTKKTSIQCKTLNYGMPRLPARGILCLCNNLFGMS